MSARTIHNTDELVVAIPVDMVEIVNGPAFRRVYEIMGRLNQLQLDYVKQLFTLRTPASASVFQRDLSIATFFDYDDQAGYTFTALFCGKIVSGRYQPRTRTGWFNLD